MFDLVGLRQCTQANSGHTSQHTAEFIHRFQKPDENTAQSADTAKRRSGGEGEMGTAGRPQGRPFTALFPLWPTARRRRIHAIQKTAENRTKGTENTPKHTHTRQQNKAITYRRALHLVNQINECARPVIGCPLGRTYLFSTL